MKAQVNNFVQQHQTAVIWTMLLVTIAKTQIGSKGWSKVLARSATLQ